MSSPEGPEGIYIAYLTGVAGTALAMFTFSKGKVIGADISGLVMAGEYQETKGSLDGMLNYTFPAGTASITGVTSQDVPLKLSVPFAFELPIDEERTYRIDTPMGPLNAKLKKAASFDE